MDGESDHGFSFNTLLQQPRNADVTHPKRFSTGNPEWSQYEGTFNPPLSDASEAKRRKPWILICFLTKGYVKTIVIVLYLTPIVRTNVPELQEELSHREM